MIAQTIIALDRAFGSRHLKRMRWRAVTALAMTLFVASSGVARAAGAASLVVTPDAAINASTYNTGSFVVTNESSGGVRILRVRLDLSSALLPDLAFDPLGQAGDTVAKCLTVDSTGVGFVTPADPCASPFSVPFDGGYRALTLDFLDFRANRSFAFSVDIDPTVIRGASAPGPGESGSVSGLELTGAVAEFTFDDGSVLNSQLFGTPGSLSGSQASAFPFPPPAPAVSIAGIPSLPVTVGNPVQTVRVAGTPGAPVAVLVVEAGLDTSGLSGGGFDVDPFEATSALAVQEIDAVLDGSGRADIPVTLTRSAATGGLNTIVATERDPLQRTGGVSPPIVLVPEDCTAPPPRSPTLDVEPGSVSWTPLPGAMAYDLIRGSLTMLRATHGDYGLSVTDCLAAGQSGQTFADVAAPPAGSGFFYLVRGRSCGGAGTYDESEGWGQAAPRDAGVDQSAAPCP
jgi:hypothetical protein